MKRYEASLGAYDELLRQGRVEPSSSTTFEAAKLNLFPRYLVWQAILDEIERLDPESIETVEALRSELITAGNVAQTQSTSNPGLPPAAITAMNEEREAFATFVRSVTESEAADVEPLPFRRVLKTAELNQRWDSLRAHWGARDEHHWWPLIEGEAPVRWLAFHTDWFNNDKAAVLREILVNHGVEQVFELREFGYWGCERHVSTLEPVYTGEEGYWFTPECDWLVYASHESSITVAGDWIVDEFQKRFPGCEKYAYAGPFSTTDQRGTWKFETDPR
jgi:hypothetical protein